MASGRRGGPPDLKSTLGSLLRTTLEQVGAVKDVVEQQARSRGGIIDQALVQRRRKDAMAALGESVFRLAQKGELGELALEPEIGMRLAEIDELDQGLDEDFGDDFHRAQGPEAVSSSNYRAPAAQSQEEYRVWRPSLASLATTEGHSAAASEAASASADSSADFAETTADFAKTTADFAKTTADFAKTAADSAETQDSAAPQRVARGGSRRMPRKSAQRSGGGIHFVEELAPPGDIDNDEDLESYMHEGDVPDDE